MKTALTVLLLIASVVIIIAVLMMEPKSKGMGSISGGDTNIFGSGGKKTKDALLSRVVATSFVVFLVSAVLITAI
ncbi:MAG: preprotein translocase subunit SecG [Tissierellia bacterium]|nr:preprotein translocase subunit SecG [Tissierellia bacterium]